MTYAFTYEVPINAEIYARIKEGIGPERAPGLIAHLAYRTETGLRYVDVWETKDDFEAFEHDRLHPVVHSLLQEMLGFIPPEPPRTILDIVDAWTAEYTHTTPAAP
jgi:hypothetical protein